MCGWLSLTFLVQDKEQKADREREKGGKKIKQKDIEPMRWQVTSFSLRLGYDRCSLSKKRMCWLLFELEINGVMEEKGKYGRGV